MGGKRKKKTQNDKLIPCKIFHPQVGQVEGQMLEDAAMKPSRVEADVDEAGEHNLERTTTDSREDNNIGRTTTSLFTVETKLVLLVQVLGLLEETSTHVLTFNVCTPVVVGCSVFTLFTLFDQMNVSRVWRS